MKTITKFMFTGLILGYSGMALAQEESVHLNDVGTSSATIETDRPYQKPKATRITPELSLVSSTFTGSDSANAKSITKISLGGTIDIGEQNLVTEVGMFFRQVGANESLVSDSNPNGTDVETDLNYLSVPVAAKYYFGNQRESSFFAKVGIAPSFIVGNNVAETTHGPAIRNSNPNAMTADALVGLGGKFQLTNDIGIVLEVSYWRGIAPVYSGASVYTSDFVNTLGININL